MVGPPQFQRRSHWGWDGAIAIPGLVLSLIVMATTITVPLSLRFPSEAGITTAN